MNKNRLSYLLLAVLVIVLIYFLGTREELLQHKDKSSRIKVKQTDEQNSLTTVKNKTSSNPKILSNKAVLKGMTLQETYCQLKNLNPKIPMSKRSNFSGFFGPELIPNPKGDLRVGEPIIIMAVLDKECPSKKYSIVKARKKSGNWSLEKTLNCKKASDEELFSEYGRQFTISEADRTDPSLFNWAINGPGLFITSCKQGFILTRLGKYKLNTDGYIENSNGCLLLSTSLKPIRIFPGDELSEQDPYCFSEPDQCLAILNRDLLPKFKGKLIAPFEFLINSRDQVLLQKLLKLPDPFSSDIFDHSIENLSNKDILPTGISTKSFDSFKEDFECPPLVKKRFF